MNRVIATVLLVTVPLLAFSLGGAEAKPSYDDPAQLAKLIEGSGTPYHLVDVRTPQEYASGHLPTAANIPVSEIGASPPTQDKDALIVVYCRSGNRSATAKKTLEQMGYTHVVDFGALPRWPGELVMGDKPTAD